MSITVNLHDPTAFYARDFTGSRTNPFVTVRVTTADSTADIFLSTAEECDKLIAAACKAKEMLLGVPLAHEPVTPRCESQRVTAPSFSALQCSLEQGHQGLHAACTPTGVAIAEWDDEPEPPRDCPATAEVNIAGTVTVLYCTRAAGHDGDHWDGPVNFPADDEPIDIPPRPARAPESRCGAPHPGPAILAKCNSQNGHDGPDHITWDGDGLEISRWPVTVTVPSGGVMFGPFSDDTAASLA